ncbi:MAG: biopolymer transporter ExbD [Candidatus Cloacimonetes bacterium]|nr:biopolymer transporter ExbD [Candidatus Cloacimonadota bacterium]
MQLLNRKRRSVTINITSLIDVVLLLLIFFMVSTNFIEQPGMKLDLPDAESAASSEKNEMEIIIQPDGSIFFNGEPITLEELRTQFGKFSTEASEKSLLLKADENVKHGTVVEVMDIARVEGIKKIVIASNKKPE